MNAYLIPALEATPDVLSRLISEVPVDQLDLPTHPGRFTPREVIAHVADWEGIMREERMVAPLNNPGMAINAYDEGELAITNDYAGSSIEEQLSILRSERAKTVALVKSLSNEQFATTMVHPERGLATVYDVANTIIGHDVYHMKQLTDLLLHAR